MLVLEGRRIWLKEITNEDIGILHEWRNDFNFMSLCSTRRNEISFDEFKKEIAMDLKRDRHLQCLILKEKIPIGTIYSYNLNRTDGYVFVTIYIVASYEKAGFGTESFAIFLFYLFQSLSLHKIYVEVYSYNKHSLACLKKAGFVEEGIFKEHRLHQNKRYDLVRLAFFQKEISRFKNFIDRLQNFNRERG